MTATFAAEYAAAFAEANETSRVALEAFNAFFAVKGDPALRPAAVAHYRAASTRDRLAWDRVNALTRQLHS